MTSPTPTPRRSRALAPLFAAALLAIPPSRALAATSYAPLVAGVSRTGTPYQVSSLVARTSDWTAIVSGDTDASLSSCVVAARTSGSGRIVAAQWNGWGISLDQLDNRRLTQNFATFLSGGSPGVVGITTGHGEWPESQVLDAWLGQGYSLSDIASPVTAAGLAGKRFVVVSHAFGAPFTAAEIAALRAYVDGGGGLLLIGLGWPVSTAGPWSLGDLAESFGILFARDAVTDPTDNFDGPYTPQFHLFHPQASLLNADPVSIEERLLAAHAAHPSDLPAAFQADAALRRSYLGALQAASAIASLSRPDDPGRAELHAFFSALLRDRTGVAAEASLRKDRRHDPEVASYFAFARERLFNIWLQAAPDTSAVRSEIATAGHFPPALTELLRDHRILVMDNAGLDASQKAYLADLLRSVPGELHDLRRIAFVSLIQNPDDAWPGLPPELGWSEFFSGKGGAVNSFSAPIGAAVANPFPPEVPPGESDLFTGALDHELNHIVDGHWVARDPARALRRSQLLAQAGCDSLNYLRPLPECFFRDYPGELFASTANAWFTESAKLLDVALARFDSGRREPLNQFLFFADVYSRGGGETLFYRVTSTAAPARIDRWAVALGRDAVGHVNRLDWRGTRYQFALDASGNVLSYSRASAPTATCTADPTHLCLQSSRFRVEASWVTLSGESGLGQARQLTADTGYFWFFGPDNLETLIKVLDACGFPGAPRFWIFSAGLTDVAVTMTVTDMASGQVHDYVNPMGTPFAPIQDTGTFATCSAGGAESAAGPTLSQGASSPADLAAHSTPARVGDPDAPSDTALYLNQNRFRVEARWRTAQQQSGDGHAVKLTADTGYFWFFNDANVELVVKVLDACGFPSAPRFWVFGAGLTDVEVTLTVTDTSTGQARTYRNSLGSQFQPIQDTDAFATCTP